MKIIKCIITIIFTSNLFFPEETDSTKQFSNNKIKPYPLNNTVITNELTTDEKIIREYEYLKSGKILVNNNQFNKSNNNKYIKLEFGSGIVTPVGGKLDKNHSPGLSIFSDINIPYQFMILNNNFENSIILDYSIFKNKINLSTKSILFNSSTTFKNIPLILSFGSGISNGDRNYFINSIDAKYKLPPKNMNLYFNIFLRGSWNSFNLTNKLFGLNIIYSKYFNFGQLNKEDQ